MFYYIYKIQHYFISVFIILCLYTKYPKYTDISLTTSGGIFFLFLVFNSIRKGSFSSLFLHIITKNKHMNSIKRKMLNRMKSHRMFCGTASCCSINVLMVPGRLFY